MAGPSVMVRVLADLSNFAKSAGDVAATGEGAATRIHSAFSSMLGTLNKTGVLGPFGAALDGIDTALGQIEQHGKTVGGVMLGVGGTVVGIGGALAALGSKEQAAHAQLQTAVEATGASYDDYAKKVDEAIKHNEKYGQSSVSTQDALRALTEATHDPQKALDLLGTATDLAAAKHEDLTTAAGQVGKVYNGNTKLLKEFGVTIDKTTGQTSDNKTATQALGDVLAGQAAAASDTFTGKLKAMGTAIEDQTAQFGAKYGPAITAAGGAVTLLGGAIEAASAIMGTFKTAQEAGTAATEAASTAEDVAAASSWAMLGPILLVIAAIAALAAAAYVIYRNWGTIWGGMKAAVQAVWDWIKANWPLLLGILLGPIALAVALIYTYWSQIKAGAADAVNFVKSVWNGLVSFFAGIPGRIAAVAGAVWDGIRSATASAVGFIEGLWNGLVGWMAGLPGRILSAVASLGGMLEQLGRDMIQGLINGIGQMAGAVEDKIKSVITAPVNAAKSILHIGSPSKVFADIGSDTMAGFIQGVGQMASAASSAVTDALSAPIANVPASSSAAGVAASAGRSGPAVVLQNATFSTGMDVELFMRKAAWVARTQGA